MLLPLYVACQQVPQFGEFQPATASTPPMCGKPLTCPCVCQPYLVMRPLGPSEQATESSLLLAVSYPLSYETGRGECQCRVLLGMGARDWSQT